MFCKLEAVISCHLWSHVVGVKSANACACTPVSMQPAEKQKAFSHITDIYVD